MSDIADGSMYLMESLDGMAIRITIVFNLGSGSGSTSIRKLQMLSENYPDVRLHYEISTRRDGDVETIYATITPKQKRIAKLSPACIYTDDHCFFTAWAWQQNA